MNQLENIDANEVVIMFVGTARYNTTVSAEDAVCEIIARIPHLLSWTTRHLGDERDTCHIYTQEQVACAIAAVLPDSLQQNGFLILPLPDVVRDEYGTLTVRVPLRGRGWAEGRIEVDETAQTLRIIDIPDQVDAQDALAVAAAISAAHHALGHQ